MVLLKHVDVSAPQLTQNFSDTRRRMQSVESVDTMYVHSKLFSYADIL